PRLLGVVSDRRPPALHSRRDAGDLLLQLADQDTLGLEEAVLLDERTDLLLDALLERESGAPEVAEPAYRIVQRPSERHRRALETAEHRCHVRGELDRVHERLAGNALVGEQLGDRELDFLLAEQRRPLHSGDEGVDLLEGEPRSTRVGPPHRLEALGGNLRLAGELLGRVEEALDGTEREDPGDCSAGAQCPAAELLQRPAQPADVLLALAADGLEAACERAELPLGEVALLAEALHAGDEPAVERLRGLRPEPLELLAVDQPLGELDARL